MPPSVRKALHGLAALGRPFHLLLLSEALSLLASSLGHLSLAWWISQSRGGADLARYGMVMAAGGLLALPLLAPLGDRIDKRKLIRLALLALLIEAALLCWLATRGGCPLAALCACGLIGVLAQAVLQPTLNSALPEWVSTAQLPLAIRWLKRAQALGGLLGPGLAGALLAWGGAAAALGLNLLMMVMAAAAGACLTPPPRPAAKAAPAAWWADMKDGLRAKWAVTLDRDWTLLGSAMMVCLLPCTGLLMPLRLQALQLSSAWYGACAAALSGGLLLGVSGLADGLINRLGRVRALFTALVLCGVTMAGLGLCDQGAGMVALCALLGLCMAVTQLVGRTHRLLAIPEAYRARMSAAQLANAHLAALLGPALAGALLLWLPVTMIYSVLSLAFLLSVGSLWVLPELRHFLQLDHTQVHNWYGRRYPEAFRSQS